MWRIQRLLLQLSRPQENSNNNEMVNCFWTQSIHLWMRFLPVFLKYYCLLLALSTSAAVINSRLDRTSLMEGNTNVCKVCTDRLAFRLLRRHNLYKIIHQYMHDSIQPRHVARSENLGGASYTWGQKSGGASSKGIKYTSHGF